MFTVMSKNIIYKMYLYKCFYNILHKEFVKSVFISKDVYVLINPYKSLYIFCMFGNICWNVQYGQNDSIYYKKKSV